MNMTAGGNASVPSQTLTVRVLSGAAVDASAFRLFATGKVNGDADMVFYGQPKNDDGTIALSNEGNNTAFTVDLNRLKADVQKVAFTVTCDGNQTVAGLQRLAIQVEAAGE
ncbi:tellurium resistance protein TerA, partial [Salmonella enterica subsp. enterica serovar Enteritidis]|nr:tellurium resistance protein TerA [Salmonella enterica subsp. enterica serovar Enteritidis]